MYRSILVDVDATANAHPALDWALMLAKAFEAKLTVCDVLSLPSEVENFLATTYVRRMVELRRERLARMAQELDIPARARLLAGRPAIELIEEVLGAGHDLVVRSHSRDLAAKRPTPFGAVAMELLRKCPCPVLLVPHGRVAKRPRILAAVNASSRDTDEQALNVEIVAAAMRVAEGLRAPPPELLHAWTVYGEKALRIRIPRREMARYTRQVRALARSSLDYLARPFKGRLPDANVKLRRGDAEDVIPRYAVAEGIDLVVMGTVARGGIAGLLVGNTAERVLKRLSCAVLALKPEGFVSPVRI
jgi:nucleotide-binding universal stress UspA family protein